MVAPTRRTGTRARSRRGQAAVLLGRLTSTTARRLRGSGGSVIGARVALAVAPSVLDELGAGLRAAIVSGTNGKSTTTAMLAAACRAGGHAVVSNVEGSNLRSGIVGVLSTPAAAGAELGVLEIDELVLPGLLGSFEHPVVVLLNLSRDQLDRFGEVRTVADGWRRALLGRPDVTAVANADDPLVVYGASAAAAVVFVGAGLRWRHDAASCPACGGGIVNALGSPDWWCDRCDLRRPACHEIDGDRLLDEQGRPVAHVRPGVPGRHNVGNGALAIVAATRLGVDASVAADAVGSVTSIAGRYQTVVVGGTAARLLLAKNPAGWAELLALIDGNGRPLVLAINARIADGRDPSWLWDVEYEALRGRQVIAAGDRAADLAVRLRYAEVPCEVWHGPVADRLRGHDAAEVDVLANYTAFADLLRELRL
ncbi:MAG: MurT ligase domain-containing protein [Acidimicrobiia bacterium]